MTTFAKIDYKLWKWNRAIIIDNIVSNFDREFFSMKQNLNINHLNVVIKCLCFNFIVLRLKVAIGKLN